MSSVVQTLQLSSEQIEVLRAFGIEAGTRIYRIQGEALAPIAGSILTIDGYSTGDYVFFTSGSVTDHQQMMRLIFPNWTPVLRGLFAGITVYGTPVEKFHVPENEVTIAASPNPLIQY